MPRIFSYSFVSTLFPLPPSLPPSLSPPSIFFRVRRRSSTGRYRKARSSRRRRDKTEREGGKERGREGRQGVLRGDETRGGERIVRKEGRKRQWLWIVGCMYWWCSMLGWQRGRAGGREGGREEERRRREKSRKSNERREPAK